MEQQTLTAGDRDPIMDDPDKSRRMAKYWLDEIGSVQALYSNWHKRGDVVIKRYRDERSQNDEGGNNTRRLNLLYSNTEILKPAVYGKVPQAVVERKFSDHDPIGRTSAIILERALRNELSDNGFHNSMRRARDDYLLPGRGQLWVRYQPELGPAVSIPALTPPDATDAQGVIEVDDDENGQDNDDIPGERIISESAPVDYVNWKDFYMLPASARTWEEVQACAKRVFTSRDYNKQRFGKEIGGKIKPDAGITQRKRLSNVGQPVILDDRNDRDFIIYEVWNKADGKVYWASSGYDGLCDCRVDPLELKNFFPCPEPLSAVTTNETVVPVPYFVEYQDQANQIDELTQRIALLTKALKVAGCYDSSSKGLRRLLDENVENELIPVDGWQNFTQKGGLQGSVVFMPIKEVGEVLMGCINARKVLFDDLERITGIQAVVSQTGDGRETLGGMRLKNNGAQTRLDDQREEVARFARDVVNLVGEVIANKFQTETLIECSGILYEEGVDPETLQELQTGTPGGPMPMQPPQIAGPGMPPGQAPMPPQAPTGNAMIPMQPPAQQLQPIGISPKVKAAFQRIDKAIQLLRSSIRRGYRIDIETDTMVAGDVQQERQDAMLFTKSMIDYMGAAAKIGQMEPMAIPLMGKMMQWAVRKFRTGRDLEATIDEFVDEVTKKAEAAKNGMGGQPSPAAMQQMADLKKSQMEQQRAQLAMVAEAQNDKREQELAIARHNWEMEKLKTEQDMMRERHAFEMQKLAFERMGHGNETGQPVEMATGTAQAHQSNVDRLVAAADKIHGAANRKLRVVRGPDMRMTEIHVVPDEPA